MISRLREARLRARIPADDDQRDQPPLFIDVATFGPAADAWAEYLSKGRVIAVTGRLVYREWEKDGVKRSKHQVVGRVRFGSAGNHDAGGDSAQEDSSGYPLGKSN
jgi:single-strand DNA-binding protein